MCQTAESCTAHVCTGLAAAPLAPAAARIDEVDGILAGVEEIQVAEPDIHLPDSASESEDEGDLFSLNLNSQNMLQRVRAIVDPDVWQRA